MTISELQTGRLILRQWRDQDFAVLRTLNSDSQVMEYFPKTLSGEESDAMGCRARDSIAKRGWGFRAAELKSTGDFIGFVGLHEPSSALPFTPCVEIGWRLLRKCWGKGYATEAAEESLRFAFVNLALNEVVSFTPVSNLRSAAVKNRHRHPARAIQYWLFCQC